MDVGNFCEVAFSAAVSSQCNRNKNLNVTM